jgi:alpha-L-rhamnosidase
LINAAQILNKKEDVKTYSELLSKIKEAYWNEYMTANGCLVSNTQTAYVLALQFDMLPENLRQQAVGRLVQNIEKYNNHITTGFLGTSYICDVLSRFGRTDVAYKLLLQETYPSWLYPVKQGATTIWERWDGQKPDGSFQTAEMNSFNHYAYGAIGDWMYRICAGLTEATPGFKEIVIKPHLGGGFTYMSASEMTPYGECTSAWRLKGNQLEMDVEIPVNTTATIYIPNGNENYKKVEVGSGKYHFINNINN